MTKEKYTVSCMVNNFFAYKVCRGIFLWEIAIGEKSSSQIFIVFSFCYSLVLLGNCSSIAFVWWQGIKRCLKYCDNEWFSYSSFNRSQQYACLSYRLFSTAIWSSRSVIWSCVNSVPARRVCLSQPICWLVVLTCSKFHWLSTMTYRAIVKITSIGMLSGLTDFFFLRGSLNDFWNLADVKFYPLLQR